MLRLHNADSDVILFGLVCEITDYARYAYEGNHNEHTNLFGCCGSNNVDARDRVQLLAELSVRSGSTLWSVQQFASAKLRLIAATNALRASLLARLELQSESRHRAAQQLWLQFRL